MSIFRFIVVLAFELRIFVLTCFMLCLWLSIWFLVWNRVFLCMWVRSIIASWIFIITLFWRFLVRSIISFFLVCFDSLKLLSCYLFLVLILWFILWWLIWWFILLILVVLLLFNSDYIILIVRKLIFLLNTIQRWFPTLLLFFDKAIIPIKFG